MSDGKSTHILVEKLERDRLITTAWITQEVMMRLKNPLKLARGRLETLITQLEHSAKQNAQGVLDQLTEAEKTLGSIETFLLDFNDNTKTKVKPQSIIEDIIVFFQLRLAQSGIEILNMVPEDLEVEMKSQAFQLIFLSLFLNALEAIEESAMKSRNIVFHYQEVGRDKVFTIEDDGPGLPPEVFNSLFKPFYSSKGGHIGIGLATSKKIAEEQGWNLTLTSRTGHGTLVILKIPQSSVGSNS